MNTANLQLRGLVMAIAAVLEALKCSGVLTAEELDEALDTAEKTGERRSRAQRVHRRQPRRGVLPHKSLTLGFGEREFVKL